MSNTEDNFDDIDEAEFLEKLAVRLEQLFNTTLSPNWKRFIAIETATHGMEELFKIIDKVEFEFAKLKSHNDSLKKRLEAKAKRRSISKRGY